MAVLPQSTEAREPMRNLAYPEEATGLTNQTISNGALSDKMKFKGAQASGKMDKCQINRRKVTQ